MVWAGKMLAEEDIYQCLVREIHEEANIVCEKAVLRGTINWTGFGPQWRKLVRFYL